MFSFSLHFFGCLGLLLLFVFCLPFLFFIFLWFSVFFWTFAFRVYPVVFCFSSLVIMVFSFVFVFSRFLGFFRFSFDFQFFGSVLFLRFSRFCLVFLSFWPISFCLAFQAKLVLWVFLAILRTIFGTRANIIFRANKIGAHRVKKLHA